MPVILSYHGAGGKAKALANLWRESTEQSMILVIPDASPSRVDGKCSLVWRQIGRGADTWKDLAQNDSCSGGQWTDDLRFTQVLLDKFQQERQSNAFFALGFSNGGDFIYQLLLTRQLAERFSGFAVAGAGMTERKRNASKQESNLDGFTLNQTIKRPFLFQMGTEDKKNIPLAVVAKAVDENPACQPVRSARHVMECFYFTHLSKSVGVYDMPTIRSITRDWLVRFNNANTQRHESLYPNLGAGPAPADQTITVREDYFEQGTESAAVAVLTTLDGGHDWPGWGGNRAPCPSRNCDINLLSEIIQFWRAHAGMLLPLP
ncbi:hypothetical protein GCM10007939_01040 [Amylibacter marinus]|uniref:Polyhydroxybutyrate depolymerase n=1 Tax=Amylibacter marinus TaxID=1475483 RepID=A0ABQ5VRC4_9RHOB|nr:hypothetical protein [Amylibacter marinus]GLQ33821.1 hypothetical protein GCM10007939_01040 [Amylibacter marinus]